jgi:hypothetical protein
MTKPGTPNPGDPIDQAQALADAALDEMAGKEADEDVEAEVEAHGAEKVLWSISYRT